MPERKTSEGSTLTVADEPRLVLPSGGRARVPFRRGVNHVIVDASDSSGSASVFVIDTGASFSVVTPGFVARAGLAEGPAPAAARAEGAHGAIAGAPRLHEVTGLRIGDLLVERAGMVSVDLTPVSRRLGFEVDGILGYNILSRLVTLVDYAAAQVTFVSADDPRPFEELGEPLHVLPFRLLAGAMIEVRGRVNDGEEWPFLVDLGAQVSLLTPRAVEMAGVSVDPVPARLPTMGLGMRDSGSSFLRTTASSLRFASLLIEDAGLYRVELPVFATLGYAGKPAGVVGNDLLGRYRVAIDYRRAQLRLWKP